MQKTVKRICGDKMDQVEQNKTEQKLIVERLKKEKQQELRKMMKGGIIRPKKSLRTVARKTGISRYKLKQTMGEEFVAQELSKREFVKGYKKTAKTTGKKLTRALKKIKKAVRPYTKTEKWYETRMTDRGRYRNPQEFEGMDSDKAVQPKFHVGTYDTKKAHLLDLRQKPMTPLLFKSPIEKETEGEFMGEGQSNLLDLSNSGESMGSKLLDLRKKR